MWKMYKYIMLQENSFKREILILMKVCVHVQHNEFYMVEFLFGREIFLRRPNKGLKFL